MVAPKAGEPVGTPTRDPRPSRSALWLAASGVGLWAFAGLGFVNGANNVSNVAGMAQLALSGAVPEIRWVAALFDAYLVLSGVGVVLSGVGVLGVVRARYVQYSATWPPVYLHGEWVAKVSQAAPHTVLSVTEDIPELKDTPQ